MRGQSLSLEVNRMICRSRWYEALLRDESAQDMIEYALLVALVALAAVASVKGVATRLTNLFGSIDGGLTNA